MVGSDWSSDVCSSDLEVRYRDSQVLHGLAQAAAVPVGDEAAERAPPAGDPLGHVAEVSRDDAEIVERLLVLRVEEECGEEARLGPGAVDQAPESIHRRDEALRGVCSSG